MIIRSKNLDKLLESLDNSEKTKKTQAEIDSLNNQLKEVKSDLTKTLVDSSEQEKDSETNKVVTELIDFSKELEKAKEQRAKAENEISAKEVLAKEFEEQGQTDNPKYQELSAEITNLKKKLNNSNQELTKIRRQNDNLKEQLNSSYQSLQEEIERYKNFLEIKKNECKIKLDKEKSWIDNILKGENNSDEKINNLIEYQKELTESKKEIFVKLKEEIISKSKDNKDLLRELCLLQEHLTQLEIKKENLEKIIQNLGIVKSAPLMPPYLANLRNELIEDNYQIDEINNYEKDKIFTESKDKFSNKKHLKIPLPFRLYNIKEERIELTENKQGSYAILSYMWGGLRNLKKEKIDKIWENSKGIIDYKNDMTDLGYKSWLKAVKTCELLGVNYLWMDQLCINQKEETPEEQAEMNQEVGKMRQYYSNAAYTLVSIQTTIGDTEKSADGFLENVVKSPWFSRSWTFQEGWLSKHSMFMFDNRLVDGNLLAHQWVLGQPSYTKDAKFEGPLEEGSQKIATPVGWTYYKKGYGEEDKVSFSLNQALRTIKNRGRYLPVDSIYSILGLIPYGSEVKVNYKLGENGRCLRDYNEQELKKVLFDIMKIAMKHGYGDIIGWFGIGNDDWLPKVYYKDSYEKKEVEGGVSVEGSIEITYKDMNKLDSSPSINFNGYLFKISKKPKISEIIRRGKNNNSFNIDSGSASGNFLIETEKGEKNLILLTSHTILAEKVKDSNLLLLLDKNEWRWNKPFALIVNKQESSYERIGLAEIKGEDFKELQGLGRKEQLRLSFNEIKPTKESQEENEKKLDKLLTKDPKLLKRDNFRKFQEIKSIKDKIEYKVKLEIVQEQVKEEKIMKEEVGDETEAQIEQLDITRV